MYLHNSGQVCCILTDTSGNYIYINNFFHRLFCSSPETSREENIENRLTPKSITTFRQAIKGCTANNNMPVETALYMKDTDGNVQLVNWEFSVSAAEDQVVYIAGIGVISQVDTISNSGNIVNDSDDRMFELAIQKQKQITQATIDAQEKERMLIGKELHDNISQYLTTSRIYLEVAKEKATGEIKDMISFSHKNLVSIIQEIRSLSQSLVPPALGDMGLVESIQDLSDAVKREYNITVDFYHRHFQEDNLPDNLKLMLFRVTQEQINHITRHTNARKAEISLQSDAEFLHLAITDDGRELDIHHYKTTPGFENIVNRVSLFNGKADKEIIPGKGCVLTINVPAPVDELVEN